MVNGPIGVQGAAIPIWELLTHEEKVKFEKSARVIDSSSFMILSFVDFITVSIFKNIFHRWADCFMFSFTWSSSTARLLTYLVSR